MVHRISHQPGWLASCNTGLKVILAHQSSPGPCSCNQFPCTDMFLWKSWINKLVTLCSHDHFQFEFHLISQIYYSIDPEHFQGKLFAFKKSRRTDFSQFSSVWMLLWVFIPTSCFPRQDFPRVFPRRTYISVQGCFFFCEEITLSALKLWNEFNKCGK